MDFLVRGQFVFTQNRQQGANDIIADGAVHVSERDIVEVGRYKDLRKAHPNITVLGGPRFWVMPGFVNAHQHGKGLTQIQLGGCDESLELTRLLVRPQASVPAYIDTLYGALRMIEAGITTCIHYNSSRGPAHYEPDVRDRIRAYRDAGLRVSFGLDIRNRNHLVYGDEEFLANLPPALKQEATAKLTGSRTAAPEDYFRLVKQLSETIENEGRGRIRLFLTPAGPQWCTSDLLEAIRREAAERNLGVQIHVLETKYQRSYFQRAYKKTAVEWLDDLDFLSPRVSLAHGVWLSSADIKILSQRSCTVVHNASSNLRLKSGIAPINFLYRAGVPLAMGLDSSTLNDDSDMLQEMRLCANLHRVPGVKSDSVPPDEILRMATSNGARALGWGAISGTLEPGKRADMILLDTRSLAAPYLSPYHSPIDTLVHRGKASYVDTVIVDGEILYQGKKHLKLKPYEIRAELKKSLTPPSMPADKSLVTQLLPYVVRYYQAWDDDTLTPHYIVNSTN